MPRISREKLFIIEALILGRGKVLKVEYTTGILQ
jgi:hypothetical protein